ncbi:hypothetical protein JRC04_19155 [Mycolicibacterium sp. S2-37]|uniref:hypothetical protein n=1 Tax=Mycolicibacterium sp. S2-37 TaxID=2810297 RepID=UPI001A94E70E|nr:hypothetical protein [Mycolicibacterium sp. S2-37]
MAAMTAAAVSSAVNARRVAIAFLALLDWKHKRNGGFGPHPGPLSKNDNVVIQRAAGVDHRSADDQRYGHGAGVHGPHVLDGQRQQAAQRRILVDRPWRAICPR